MLIDGKSFFEEMRVELFGGFLNRGQVSGTQVILDSWDQWAPGSDQRFVAYSLATTMWETASTMLPIEEYGRGRGRAYGVPAGPWHQVYDGRGDVQLTWYENYMYADAELKKLGILAADQNLAENPALAMQPRIAAPIMIFGMLQGWFTGLRLDEFFTPTASSWSTARRIINGLDHAAQIGSYASTFNKALSAGKWSSPEKVPVASSLQTGEST